MSTLTVRARNQDGSVGDVLMVIHDDGHSFTVDGDGLIAESFRDRKNPPPITSTDPGQRLIEFVGSIPTYWVAEFT